MTRPFPGLGQASLLLAAALALQAGVAWMLLSLNRNFDLTLLAGLTNLVALGAVVAFGFSRAGWPNLRSRSPRDPGLWWVGLLLTAAGGTVVLGEVSNGLTAVVPLPADLARLFDRLTLGTPAISLFTLALVAPVTEEALFRGLLLPAFVRRYGRTGGLLLSSVLFGLFHLNLWQALPAAAAGLFLGWVALRSGSLTAPIAVHAAFNGLPVLLAALGLQVSGYNTGSAGGQAEFQPPVWLAGGLAALVLGLVLSRRGAPLSPDRDSATMAP